MERKKIPPSTVLGTLCTHTCLNNFLNFFFFSKMLFLDPIKDKKLLLFQFFLSHASIWWEIHKILRIKKYSLEQKCEWNLSILWLFLATVTSYMTCLDRVVLTYQSWALATFLVYFSVLNNVGQIEHLELFLPPSSFTFVEDAGCLQAIPTALMSCHVCQCFHYRPFSFYVVLPYLLPEKEDKDVLDDSSFVTN